MFLFVNCLYTSVQVPCCFLLNRVSFLTTIPNSESQKREIRSCFCLVWYAYYFSYRILSTDNGEIIYTDIITKNLRACSHQQFVLKIINTRVYESFIKLRHVH